MPYPTHAVAVRHPQAAVMIALDPAIDYDPDDLLVKTYPWAFEARKTGTGIVESVSIEKATAEPGQKRTRTKPAK